MNKQGLIDEIRKKVDLSKRDIENVLLNMIDIVENTVAADQEVMIMGFGTFKKEERKAKACRNPSTKEMMVIPARKLPVFKAGGEFKEKMI